jgi:hypothetical protein
MSELCFHSIKWCLFFFQPAIFEYQAFIGEVPMKKKHGNALLRNIAGG